MIVEKTLFPLTMTASPALTQRHLGLLKIFSSFSVIPIPEPL